jgi:hypothetical protein
MQMSRLRVVALAMTIACAATMVVAQRPNPRVNNTVRPIIFAVLNDGGTLEPIAEIDGKRLRATVNGSDDVKRKSAFHGAYYKAGTTYRLIFGGTNAGSVSVKSSDVNAECASNMATVTTRADKTPLKGLVMGLATNGPADKATGMRRRPTDVEKDEIEKLVRSEYARQKLTPKALRYHNLTALDIDGDGSAEFVGSYWTEIDKQTRGLLFFIAGKNKDGRYALEHKEYRTVDQSKVMSGDIKNVDDGVLHELLLDVYDYDGDGRREVFTYVQSFEGAGFNVYKKSGGRWTRVFEGSNYHCAF